MQKSGILVAIDKKQELKDQIRLKAESSLEAFIRLVHPQRVLGKVHEELLNWWTRKDAKDHQLVLLPRDHGKSAMVAYRVAWEITRDPTIRVLYISSTANLAEKQLEFIKQIITSPIYRSYWPEMVQEQESKRSKWTTSEIAVDHPKRLLEAVRDPTIFTAGLTTGITGLHCDIAVLDDVVVHENASTDEGREKVKFQYSLLSSIEGAGAREWVVGTRYHPKDLYNDILGMAVEVYNEDGEVIGTEAIYEIFERQVEDRGDGTGNFLWPVQHRYDGKQFGFNQSILATKRNKYLNQTQFRAQYYNDPNEYGNSGITREMFQYYDRRYLKREAGNWFFKGTRLNVFAAIDFAYSLSKKADYTCIAVIGIDSANNYYILELDRFKEAEINEYYSHLLKAYNKWGFKKVVAEVTAAQQVIVNDLKNNYIRVNGLNLTVEEHRPNKYQGAKEERIYAALQPKYANRQFWHPMDGMAQVLEEELVATAPPHDDCKDALASATTIAVAPAQNTYSPMRLETTMKKFGFGNSRFGGIR
jgi:phage terminase large subunit-like protein